MADYNSRYTGSQIDNAVGKSLAALPADNTLSTTGKAADAKKTGDEISGLKSASNGLAGSVAPVATTSTASRAYAAGDLLMYNNQLYKVASTIASGQTLTPGTNIIADTVADYVTEKISSLPANVGKTKTFMQFYYDQFHTGDYLEQTVASRTISIIGNVIKQRKVGNSSTVCTFNLFGDTSRISNKNVSESTVTAEMVRPISDITPSGSVVLKTMELTTKYNGTVNNAIYVVYYTQNNNAFTYVGSQRLSIGNSADKHGVSFLRLQISNNATHYALLFSSNYSDSDFDVVFELDVDTSAQ